MDKNFASFVVGAAVGTAALPLISQAADTQRIAQLGPIGKPSTAVGVIGGGLATALGIMGHMGKGPTRKSKAGSMFLAGTGVTLLVRGLINAYMESTGATIGGQAILRVGSRQAPVLGLRSALPPTSVSYGV